MTRDPIFPDRLDAIAASRDAALPESGRPDDPAGSEPVVGALPPRRLRRPHHTLESDALAQTLTPPPKVYAPSQGTKSTFKGARLAQVLAERGTADAAGQPPVVGRAAGRLAPRTDQPDRAPQPTAPAPDLPVTALGGDIKRTLSRAAPDCAAVLFEHINRLSNLARYTEQQGLVAESVMASNLAGRLAIKTIEMTVGKQLNVNATITNQTTIPDLRKLSPAAQQAILDAFAQVSDAEVIGPVVEGEVVAQTSDQYRETHDGPP